MPHIATIMHISDLHFVKNLFQDSSDFWPFRKILADRHSFSKAEALAIATGIINRDVETQADLTIITGDITTDGKAESFDTVLNYLSSDMIQVSSTIPESATGLNTKPASRIIVPGNHDRYNRRVAPVQTKSRVYERMLLADLQALQGPVAVGHRFHGGNRKDVPAVISFVFDSTRPEHVHSKVHWKTARGFVSSSHCKQLVDLSKSIEKSGKVRSFDGKDLSIDYSNCIRLVVVHHDPFEKDNKKLMQNSPEFKRACEDAKIDLVLYGHTHEHDIATLPEPSRTDHTFRHRTHYICAPSATAFSEKNNGFYVYDVSTTGIEAWEYAFDEDDHLFIIKSGPHHLKFSR